MTDKTMESTYTPLQGSCSSCRKELGHDVVEAVLFRQLSGLPGVLVPSTPRPLRLKSIRPPSHSPPQNDTMNGASRQQTPRCVYIGLVLICGHTHYKLLHDCASCLQQLQQIQHSPNAEYSFNWPALCRPTPGVNVYYLRVPAPQVCPSCQQQGLRWRGSTGLYS
ncbi:MAG: hypothetical protein LQ339_008146 [Xanthoria mediterranea]|nr:MAG: hypothetical protein LQ339_008146 [Xanthoria mediterranea]